MRILICVVLFHMLYRSTGILYPWEDWLGEVNLSRMPRALPTRSQIDKMREEAEGSNEQVLDEFKKCGLSLARYWNCVPEEETRARLKSPLDWTKYALAWTASRLQWCECILGIDQEWAMFSPKVGRGKYMSRARLCFEDGTERVVRSLSEPEDYTSYTRFGAGKTLGLDRFVFSDQSYRHEACAGYCNFLAHQTPTNQDGARLEAILLYEFKINFVPPGEDAHAFLREEMRQTSDHRSTRVSWTFYVFFPETKAGTFIDYVEGRPRSYSDKIDAILLKTQ